MQPDANFFEKVKETKNYIIYLEKKPVFKNQIDMIVKYNGKDFSMRCLLTDELFKLFFSPTDYAKIYARLKQR